MKNWDSILGMNARNAFIAEVNSGRAIRLVNNKQATKEALQAAGAPVTPTLHFITTRSELKRLNLAAWPDTWAIKPNQSMGGTGVLLAFGRNQAGNWLTGSGREITPEEVQEHLRRILDGEFSPRDQDAALVEPLLQNHPALAGLAPRGLPDIRLICLGPTPQAAMARLPTIASEGRANLHQGGVGTAVDLETGVITAALLRRKPVEYHPDTGHKLVGTTIPHWPDILAAAQRCTAATGLYYLGADVVVDAQRGPLVLEVNARPGLEIQNVGRLGLLEKVMLNIRGDAQ
jgi:alpha-L-glutamate ligase-like protein